MIQLLYIGNKLSVHGLNKTTIETLGENLEKEGFLVKYASDKSNFLFRLLEMIWATATIKKCDYLLLDTYSSKAFWFAFICSQIARVRKIKYIPILHGGNLPNRLKKKPFLTQLIFKNAYINVAPSNYLKSEFEKKNFTNIIFIPNSIELEKYTFKKREKLQPKLLWVRAFATIYNPEMAIYVLAKIVKKYPSASLTMIGPDKDGSMQTTKELAKKLQVEVTFTGQLSKKEWHNLAQKHDIFINTTHFDNTPVSLLEIMALGLPIISTNVGGIPFLINHKKTGYLVEDNAVLQMEESVKKLVEDTALAQYLITNAKEEVEQWNWKVVKKEWIKLLK